MAATWLWQYFNIYSSFLTYLFPYFFRPLSEVQAAEVNCADVNRARISLSENFVARILDCRHNCNFSTKFITIFLLIEANMGFEFREKRPWFWEIRDDFHCIHFNLWTKTFWHYADRSPMLILNMIDLMPFEGAPFSPEKQYPQRCRKLRRCAPCFSLLRPF